MKLTRWIVLSGTVCLGAAGALGQAPAVSGAKIASIQTIEVKDTGGQILSFKHLQGTTVVDMRGTRIEPGARTQLKVESRPGFLEIDINRGDIRGLQPARRFGKDFLTYVLWAVSVDGEPQNLGEITFDRMNQPVSINVTTPYQTFWLMVTAEPDFAVNDPSPVVVMYSVNQDSTPNTTYALPVDGKLLYHTYYSKYDTTPAEVQAGIPNELLQARKAVELASASGILATPTPAGEEPLPDEERTRQTLAQARKYLQQAEDAHKNNSPADAAQFARTAAQIAENARALALGAAGGLYARQLDRDLAKARAEIEKLKADMRRLMDEATAGRQAASKLAECEKELAALRQQLQQLQAQLAAEGRSSSDARQRLTQLEQELAACQQQLATVTEQLRAAQAENARLREDREKICGELRRQLSSLGQLTEQGGNMVLTLASDILFDFNSADLKPVARENLAKLAALRMLLFSQADVRYEGHTDRVGEDDYNQWLSEQRALSVYRYFLEERIARESDAAAREAARDRLTVVQQLLAMPYGGARRGTQQADLMAKLGDSVIGKGEREPVEDVQTQSERNRRVVLLFPPAQTGQATSLCEQR